jgi:hypothetical protein
MAASSLVYAAKPTSSANLPACSPAWWERHYFTGMRPAPFLYSKSHPFLFLAILAFTCTCSRPHFCFFSFTRSLP